ncbi:hypothetical protein DJ568_05170 [Mucilaginibacter hurinus]|uniref:Uncharacterized protein n=1 Tax=Mucilaginibacter hurinus TaxID=2201324 RepID=A0A367GRP7_9SPHI|nr:hypothetical protein [Mucilaginibacter hurinus]RCH56137.1 hypothetical protein DJ568_05170 [Mucilaginibacter hurinus]
MKKITVMLLLSIATISYTSAQTLPAINELKLNSDDACVAADKVALQVAEYLFATPFITDDEDRLRASAFINRWMDCTPTYTFLIDEDITANFDDDPDLVNMYMAALTVYTLQNPDVTDEDKISIGALKKVLDYADKDANMVLLTSRMQKLVEANKKKQLESAM